MVSRRKILSRSRDDLHQELAAGHQEDEDDVWYQREKLFKVSKQYFRKIRLENSIFKSEMVIGTKMMTKHLFFLFLVVIFGDFVVRTF